MKSGNKATKITWKRRHGPRSGKEKEQLLTSCLLLPNWRENPKSRFATETRTVCGTPCRAPSRVLRTVPQATSRLAGHESGHVPPQVGLARHRTFRWAGVHDLVKTNFAKKGSSVSSQPRQPKTSPPRTTKPVDSAPARTRILFSPPTAHFTVWQLALSDLSPARLQPRHASVNIELCLRRCRPEPRLERKRTQRFCPRCWKR